MLTTMEIIKNIMDNLVMAGLGTTGIYLLVQGVTAFSEEDKAKEKKRRKNIRVSTNRHDKAA